MPDQSQPLYALTQMTGPEASSTRTTVVGIAEVPWRVVIILIVAFLAGLPLMLMVGSLFGPWVVFFVAAWLSAAVWLFHGRIRNGLRIRNYAHLLNRQRAILNEFMLGPAIVHVPHHDWRLIGPGSVKNPAQHISPADLEHATRARRPAAIAAAVFDHDA